MKTVKQSYLINAPIRKVWLALVDPKVTFELSEEDSQTKIKLTRENIPDDEAKDIKDGWKRYLFESSRRAL